MEIRLKNILCAMDFSDYTRRMLHYAVGLARRFDARLVVFHSVFLPEDQLYATGVAERSGELNEKAGRAVGEMEKIMAPYDVNWFPVAAKGDPVETVAQAASQNDADLVIAFSHGVSGLKRIWMGVVVERMARGLDRPFLVVRPPEKGTRFDARKTLSFKKVIVGCDLSREISPALAYARFFAKHFDAELHLLHSMESPVNEELIGEIGGHYDEVQQTLAQRLKQRLLNLFPDREEEGLKLNVILEIGIPGEALVRHARKLSADLMVVGLKRRGVLEKLLVGSTTEAVIRHSPCPVLVVSPGADPEKQ